MAAGDGSIKPSIALQLALKLVLMLGVKDDNLKCDSIEFMRESAQG